ncbi:catabolite control protein A [Hazenella sp. IB182357]|uniref:Catabolite control protein A n=1 Tax=Polycladospora coralii TaxID=2771432 RepID=A0A926N7K3_9BACL|nr:catabolite control protein A [Polycladospora coralii]MBD1370928.1 catabolite control protein A [Polycladospora coralii]MBS7529867.1 catabolite control protein A [Polycladospora coralii]
MEKKSEAITIYDVAREAGVSMATVSRVVNGNPNVKPSTRKKVLNTIRELGYRPNAVARGLASKKTTTVGVVIPDISNAFYAELTRGIEDIATMYHYHIILSNSDLNQEKEYQLINAFFEKQVDGLLFLGGELTNLHRETFSASTVPVVLAATEDDTAQLPYVTINQKEAAKEATQVLLEEGHEHIAFIGEALSDPVTGYPRYSGYKEALLEQGKPISEKRIRIGDGRYRSGYQLMTELINENPDLTAVFATSDEMAVGAIHAVQDQGKKVPTDISVIGFNNIPLSSQVRPLLSTINVPMYDIGAVAMRLLTKYMNQEQVDTSQVYLQHHIEIRQSNRVMLKKET